MEWNPLGFPVLFGGTQVCFQFLQFFQFQEAEGPWPQWTMILLEEIRCLLSSWGKGSLSHYLQGFCTLQVVVRHFWTINSMTLWCWGFGLTRGAPTSDHGKWFLCKSESTRSVYCHECNKAQDHDQLIIIITMLQWLRRLRRKISGNHLPLVPFFLAPKWARPV